MGMRDFQSIELSDLLPPWLQRSLEPWSPDMADVEPQVDNSSGGVPEMYADMASASGVELGPLPRPPAVSSASVSSSAPALGVARATASGSFVRLSFGPGLGLGCRPRAMANASCVRLGCSPGSRRGGPRAAGSGSGGEEELSCVSQCDNSSWHAPHRPQLVCKHAHCVPRVGRALEAIANV